jgi:CRISPR-associated protein Cas1
VLSGRKSEPTLLMARPHNDASKRIAQYRMSLDKEACLIFSKELVKEKISYQYDFLSTRRELDLNHRYELTVSLRKLEAIRNVIHEKESIPSLMGLEGAAAAGYFEAISVIAPPRLGFSHRNRRPPRDPLNAIFSLGYTLLHAEAVLAIYGFGLDPFIGFYHQLDFSRESLACDLSELFRVEIDSFSLDLFRKDILRVEDFSTTNSGCSLGKNGRAKYYKEWEIFAEKFRKKLNESINEISDRFLNPI